MIVPIEVQEAGRDVERFPLFVVIKIDAGIFLKYRDNGLMLRQDGNLARERLCVHKLGLAFVDNSL